MTSSSPLELAIQRISMTGWMLKSLSRSVYDSVKPWTCELYPGHFGGSYFPGTPNTDGYKTFSNPMATVMGEGATALEAVRDALLMLDKSDAAELYDDLERAFGDRVNAALQTRD